MSLDEHSPSQYDQQQAHQVAPPQQQGTSGLAIAGIITAFLLAPVGFILSLIALFKTGPGKQKGRGLAVVGLIVSMLAIGGAVTAGVLVANSTVVDPGCTDGKAAILKSANSTDPASMQATVDALNAAAAKAKNDDVRAATKALADDYAEMLNGTKTGNLSQDIVARVEADANKFDSLCTVGS